VCVNIELIKNKTAPVRGGWGLDGYGYGTHYLMLLHLIGNFCLSSDTAAKRWNYEKSICIYIICMYIYIFVPIYRSDMCVNMCST